MTTPATGGPPTGDLDYVEAEVRRLLAEDPGIGEQGIEVRHRERVLVLRGEVESPGRRREILRTVRNRFPGLALRADISVSATHPPDAPEELP
ncbi:MAG TPA: BON domain-containing protein [Natronosporangium sp.]|jgi:HSP20 family molecular chaperone IbpA|nr:BON domain-containing protein [Natronosporangium sp.]